MLGKDVKVFTGASGAAVLKGVTADRGEVFVKTWCGLKGGYRQTPRNQPVPETCGKDGASLAESEKQKCEAARRRLRLVRVQLQVPQRAGRDGGGRELVLRDAAHVDGGDPRVPARRGYGEGTDAGEPDPQRGRQG